ncbi:hypothetical protein LX32DRAFT_596247, partial [Colletotrichum zoysiae]
TFTLPSEASKRIFWTLNGPIESSIQVAPNPYYEPGDVMEPYFRPSAVDDSPQPNWHPAAQESLREPPISEATVRVDCIDGWEALWKELNYECTNIRIDPRRPRAKHILLEVRAGDRGFITIHDYISAVHPWLMDMRESILYASGKGDGRGVPWPSETRLTVVHFGNGPITIGNGDKQWARSHRKPNPPVYMSKAERTRATEKSSQRAMERSKAISAARIQELERLRQQGNA